jgi:Flp pilus assembly protein protease CpaA
VEFNTLAQYVLTGILLSILIIASKEDMRYHRISKKYVMLILVFTLLYTLVYKTYGLERTAAFLIAFGMFGGMTLLSRGKFGFGDSIIISAIALYIGRVNQLGYFFIILAFVSIAWGAYCYLKTRHNSKTGDKKTLWDSFSSINTITIDKLVPGMILANDNFMQGLNEEEIMDLKKQGLKELQIKYAYPFIPVILMSFIVYLTIVQYSVF